MTDPMTADEERMRRLRMRSWRRGMKEMDLILGPFADGPLASLPEEALERYETLMSENDQDLYRWITARIGGRAEGPENLAPLIAIIADHAAERLKG